MSLNRRDLLAASVSAIPLYYCRLAAAQQTASLVDYLKSMGRERSVEARRQLWNNFRPAEKYIRSAEQNTALLKAIRNFDDAPRATLTKAVFSRGEDVTAKLEGRGELLIESDLRRQSFNGIAGNLVNLGSANAAGLYEIWVTDGQRDSRMLLSLWPRSNSFEAHIIMGATT